MNGNLLITNEYLLGHVCDILASGKRVKLRAKGKSMRPFIREESDTLLLAPVASPRKGDIVLARTEAGDYIIHRIIRMDGDSVILAGDGNLFKRETVSRQSVYGRVEAVIRNGKCINLTDFVPSATVIVWRLILPFRRCRWKCRRFIHSLIKKNTYEKD